MAFPKGNKRSEETKEKLRKAMKGRRPAESTRLASIKARLGKKRPPEVCKKISDFWKGRPRSPEHKERLRLSMLATNEKKRNGKPKAPDRHDSGIYDTWRKSVLVRDDYTCQTCSKRGGKLHAHHLMSWGNFPDLRYDIDNGITLCPFCHAEANREQYQREKGLSPPIYVHNLWKPGMEEGTAYSFTTIHNPPRKLPEGFTSSSFLLRLAQIPYFDAEESRRHD